MNTRLPLLIGIYSPHPSAGKSTLARMLRTHRYRSMPFAADLKAWLAQLLLLHGYSIREARHYLSTAKGEPLTRIPGAPTARHLLVTLGTGWGREQIDRRVWLAPWVDRVMVATDSGHRLVADDLRFPDELDAIHALGGIALQIDRPAAPGMDPSAAPAEGLLCHCGLPVIINDTTPSALLFRALRALDVAATHQAAASVTTSA